MGKFGRRREVGGACRAKFGTRGSKGGRLKRGNFGSQKCVRGMKFGKGIGDGGKRLAMEGDSESIRKK